jgi:hypothetical protein
MAPETDTARRPLSATERMRVPPTSSAAIAVCPCRINRQRDRCIGKAWLPHPRRRPPTSRLATAGLGGFSSGQLQLRAVSSKLMEVTAGEPVREECLKGRLNRFGVFALVRGQVSPRNERI